MKQNNKGLFQTSWAVISLIMFLLFGTFIFIFYDQVIDEYWITPLDNISHNVVNELGIDSRFSDTLDSLKTAYDARFIPYDLIFLFLFALAFIGTNRAATRARKLGVFSFFGYIFLFSMAFLLVMYFIGQFTDYFIVEIFNPIFSDTVLDTPIINWFFNNINVVGFVWFLWLGLVNQFDIKKVVREKTRSVLEGGFQR